MGCPLELWLRVAVGAIRRADHTWWRSVLSDYLEDSSSKHISWEEFREVYINQFFASTVVGKKGMEFMMLEQRNMTVVEHQPASLPWERFALGSFQTKR